MFPRFLSYSCLTPSDGAKYATKKATDFAEDCHRLRELHHRAAINPSLFSEVENVFQVQMHMKHAYRADYGEQDGGCVCDKPGEIRYSAEYTSGEENERPYRQRRGQGVDLRNRFVAAPRALNFGEMDCLRHGQSQPEAHSTIEEIGESWDILRCQR